VPCSRVSQQVYLADDLTKLLVIGSRARPPDLKIEFAALDSASSFAIFVRYNTVLSPS
jgi:hypothetical protein